MTDKRSFGPMGLLRFFAVASFVLASACASAPVAHPSLGQGMVSSADPRASAAGVAMLEAGGTATDAAIATMLVLGLVEPQSAGIGGGAFLMSYDAASEQIDAYDGREWAPAGATPEMFLLESGQPMAFREAVLSGRSVGTPSLVAMLHMVHAEHGRLPWAQLAEPAIRLAEDGFIVSERLHQMIQFGTERGRLREIPALQGYFFTAEGAAMPVGTVIRNPAYAATLRAIVAQGPRAMTHGPIAEAIVAAAQAGPVGGTLTLADLQAYQPRRLDPLCGPYRDFQVCSIGPPSSGGIAVLSILGTYQILRPEPVGAAEPDDWAAYLWASRLAYTDRDHYVGDDQFVPVPTQGLVDPRYLASRVPLVDLNAAAPAALTPGDPSSVVGGESLLNRWGRDRTNEVAGTTHLSVVDPEGNAIALTATVESIFGSQRFAAGFFLNNQLTDFSLEPTRFGGPVANAVAPRKRPRSSMAPVIMVDGDGELRLVIGSPGGSGIISYVSRAIIGHVDWGLPIQDAIALPIMVASRPDAVRTEMQLLSPAIAEGLGARGWRLQPTTLEASGLHAIAVTAQGLDGGADPRREGAALGMRRAAVRPLAR
jgi:gamma-glutamyltranspeptidase / glutathione hydrolase